LRVRWGHNSEDILTEKKCNGKTIFSKTIRLISIKLDDSYLCMKGFKMCSNKKSDPQQRENNHRNANRA
jgi:hypothetical protein